MKYLKNERWGIWILVLFILPIPITISAQSTVIQYQEDFRNESNFFSKVRQSGKSRSTQEEIELYTPTEVFPNPAPNKEVTIKFEDIRERVIQVIQPTGEPIYQEIIQNDILQLDLVDFPAGIYTIMITDTQTNIRTVERVLIGLKPH